MRQDRLGRRSLSRHILEWSSENRAIKGGGISSGPVLKGCADGRLRIVEAEGPSGIVR